MFSNCLLYRVHQCMGQQGHPVPVSCHDYNSVHTELVISWSGHGDCLNCTSVEYLSMLPLVWNPRCASNQSQQLRKENVKFRIPKNDSPFWMWMVCNWWFIKMTSVALPERDGDNSGCFLCITASQSITYK